MRTKLYLGFVVAFGLVLSACSNTAEEETSRLAGSSKATYVSLENQLNDWWGGNGIPITWRVSETVNADWEGVSRPDAAPPQGLQGLEQQPFSEPQITRLEINYNPGYITITRRFVLTPEIKVDGQKFDLAPITFSNVNYMADGWNMEQAGTECIQNTPAPTVRNSYSQRTPRGLLQYDILLTCPEGMYGSPASVLIRNYKKG